MAKRIIGSTPKRDGYRMPAEFEPQSGVWMLWPERNDNWRDGAKPAQRAFLDVAEAILQFEPVTVCVSAAQYQNARERLPRAVRVVEMASNDAWIRDCGPTFLVNDRGGLRAVDWTFNAWGGLVDGLYFPWDLDDQVAQKVCELERVDSYRTEGFVLEGGSIHVDGEGTVLTTEMCLLSEGRNPSMDRGAIEHMLCEYLGCEKVLWLRDGIDPDETNGHIDDVACFIRPGEVACIWTDDPAFGAPAKPIGAFYDAAAAQRMQHSDPTLHMREDSGRGWRRVVASPKPVDIVERRSILNLLDNEYIVIACGGGGVPVARDAHGDYYGVDAVIDKDFASACLAEAVGADYLFILTAVDHFCLNFGTPEQRALDVLHADDAERYLREGQFGAGSMQPKVAAAVQFVRSGWRRRAVIASLAQAPAAMRGESGTRIVP